MICRIFINVGINYAKNNAGYKRDLGEKDSDYRHQKVGGVTDDKLGEYDREVMYPQHCASRNWNSRFSFFRSCLVFFE